MHAFGCILRRREVDELPLAFGPILRRASSDQLRFTFAKNSILNIDFHRDLLLTALAPIAGHGRQISVGRKVSSNLKPRVTLRTVHSRYDINVHIHPISYLSVRMIQCRSSRTSTGWVMFTFRVCPATHKRLRGAAPHPYFMRQRTW